jgi:hypothetical protein
MNERIRELEDKIWAEEYWSNPDTDKLLPAQLNRFAELIVKECIGCCEQVISDPVPKNVDTWLNGGEQCIQEIKEHFGLGMSVEDKKQLIKDLLGVSNGPKS